MKRFSRVEDGDKVLLHPTLHVVDHLTEGGVLMSYSVFESTAMVVFFFPEQCMFSGIAV